jgi:hypothetical protein
MMAGNIVFSGFGGAVVDAGAGATYDCPILIKVMMGRKIATFIEN